MSAHPIFEHLFANLGLMARKEARHEAEHGICVEDLEASADLMADIPWPLNPVNQEDEE